MSCRKSRIKDLEERIGNVRNNIKKMMSVNYNELNKPPLGFHVQEDHLEALEKELQTLYLEDAIDE